MKDKILANINKYKDSIREIEEKLSEVRKEIQRLSLIDKQLVDNSNQLVGAILALEEILKEDGESNGDTTT